MVDHNSGANSAHPLTSRSSEGKDGRPGLAAAIGGVALMMASLLTHAAGFLAFDVFGCESWDTSSAPAASSTRGRLCGLDPTHTTMQWIPWAAFLGSAVVVTLVILLLRRWRRWLLWPALILLLIAPAVGYGIFEKTNPNCTPAQGREPSRDCAIHQ